jgi:hypothetical protein
MFAVWGAGVSYGLDQIIPWLPATGSIPAAGAAGNDEPTNTIHLGDLRGRGFSITGRNIVIQGRRP